MSAVERQAVFQRGPQFFLDDGVIRFKNVIDGGNVWGPFEATEEHKAEHPGAWERFVAAGGEAVEPDTPLAPVVTFVEPEPPADITDDAEFQAAMAAPGDAEVPPQRHPLDHDGDGRKGGSVKKARGL